MPGRSTRSDAVVWGAMVAMELIWGVHFAVTKIGLRHLHPAAFAAVRVVAAAAILFAYARATGALSRLTRRDVRDALLLGLAGVAANQLLWIWGLSLTTPSHSALIISTIPVCVVILSAIFLKEPIGALRGAGIALSVAGVAALVLASPARAPGAANAPSALGDLLTVGTVVVWSVYTVAGKRVVDRAGATGVTAVAYAGGAAVIVPAGLPWLADVRWSALPGAAWASLAYVALLSSAVAYLLYYWGLRRLGAGPVALLAYLQPPVAAAISVAALGERPTAALVIGALAVLAGLALAQRGARPPAPPGVPASVPPVAAAAAPAPGAPPEPPSPPAA